MSKVHLTPEGEVSGKTFYLTACGLKYFPGGKIIGPKPRWLEAVGPDKWAGVRHTKDACKNCLEKTDPEAKGFIASVSPRSLKPRNIDPRYEEIVRRLFPSPSTAGAWLTRERERGILGNLMHAAYELGFADGERSERQFPRGEGG